MSKTAITAIVVIIILVLGGWWYVSRDGAAGPETDGEETATSTDESREAMMPDDGSYALDPVATNVEWRGSKTLIEGYEDTGTLEIKSGNFAVESGVVTEGEIVFDMTSIEASATSNTVVGIGNLTNHLKSDDFLDVSNFPTATFSLTEAEPVGGSDGGTFIFTGDLTLKGITKEIQFPVSFSQNTEGQAVIIGEFEIDRTDWDIRYGSGKFFEDLGDKTIADEVQIQFEAVATQA